MKVDFKAAQRKSWSAFAPLEIVTIIPAATLVKFSRVQWGDSVLDVGCGTGVVAVSAARLGAKVSALDICPDLLERAAWNASLASVEIEWCEGDVESLPYASHSFDVVLSQYGHMFAPRPEKAIQEMLRVLKPGGTIAFSTWPPHLFVGRLFTLVNKYSPLPEGVSPPSLWGDPHFVRESLGNAVQGLIFDEGLMRLPALSLEHYIHSIESTLGPIVKLVQESENQPLLHEFRRELRALASQYYEENYIHQHYLMSRARKNL